MLRYYVRGLKLQWEVCGKMTLIQVWIWQWTAWDCKHVSASLHFSHYKVRSLLWIISKVILTQDSFGASSPARTLRSQWCPCLGLAWLLAHCWACSTHSAWLAALSLCHWLGFCTCHGSVLSLRLAWACCDHLSPWMLASGWGGCSSAPKLGDASNCRTPRGVMALAWGVLRSESKRVITAVSPSCCPQCHEQEGHVSVHLCFSSFSATQLQPMAPGLVQPHHCFPSYMWCSHPVSVEGTRTTVLQHLLHPLFSGSWVLVSCPRRMRLCGQPESEQGRGGFSWATEQLLIQDGTWSA